MAPMLPSENMEKKSARGGGRVETARERSKIHFSSRQVCCQGYEALNGAA
jgi:hypothetical protein